MSFDLLEANLGDFLIFKNGKSSPERADDLAYPVFGSNGIIGRSEETNCTADTIVIGRVGSYCGSVHFSEEKCWVSDNAISCTTKQLGEELFWFYFLKRLNLNQFSSGSGQPLLNQATLNSVECIVPAESDIRIDIGNILRSFDRKISLNTQINQTLEAMAQAIFKSWFVDFDPVKAKMNGEQPQGMDDATASLFPDKLVESELGLIPEGWNITKLSKVIDLLNGFAFKSTDYVEDGIFVLRTKNFDESNSVERLADDVYLPDAFLKSHEKYLCQPYDYHVVMVAASIGKTGMIYPHQLPALRNQNMWCFRPKNEILRFYTKYMVDVLVTLNMGLASGSARAFFKKGDFNSYQFALPSDELLRKFNLVVGNLVKQKGALLNQNLQLGNLRDTLLPKLLSGEIELEQADVLAEAS